jgi:hypothetical protein
MILPVILPVIPHVIPHVILPAIPHVIPRLFSRANHQRRGHAAHRLLGKAAAILGAVTALGCEESGPRVYTAQAYLAEAECLEQYAPIGLVEAEVLASTCDAVCLRLGAQLYVSAVCAPYPAEASLEEGQDSAECAAALEAFESELSCDSTDAGAEEP